MASNEKIKKAPKLLIGWQEWCALPKLQIPAIKVKVDTGAKTSALHAEEISTFYQEDELLVKFTVFPLAHNTDYKVSCVAKVLDERYIINSFGQKERRYIIKSSLVLGERKWPIEISLTNRDLLSFRMLLGRKALKGRAIINPAKRLCLGNFTLEQLENLYH